MLRVVDSEVEEKAGEIPVTLDELAREGARRMLMTALEEEVAGYLAAHEERDERGYAREGFAPEDFASHAKSDDRDPGRAASLKRSAEGW